MHYAPGAHTSPQWPGVMSCHSRQQHRGFHLQEAKDVFLLGWGPGQGQAWTPPWGANTHQVWPHARSASGCSWRQWMSRLPSGGRSARHCGQQTTLTLARQGHLPSSRPRSSWARHLQHLSLTPTRVDGQKPPVGTGYWSLKYSQEMVSHVQPLAGGEDRKGEGQWG